MNTLVVITLMNKLVIVVEGILPNLNEYIKSINGSRYSGNSLKQNATDICYYAGMEQKSRDFVPISTPAQFDFVWFCRDKKVDPDNFTSAGRKFFLDGIQKAGIITNDGWKNVGGFSDKWYVDSDHPRLEVTITY